MAVLIMWHDEPVQHPVPAPEQLAHEPPDPHAFSFSCWFAEHEARDLAAATRADERYDMESCQ